MTCAGREKTGLKCQPFLLSIMEVGVKNKIFGKRTLLRFRSLYWDRQKAQREKLNVGIPVSATRFLFCYLKKGNGTFLGNCINRREGRTWLSPLVRKVLENKLWNWKGKIPFHFCQIASCSCHWRASLAKCVNRFEQLWPIKDLCKIRIPTKNYKHQFSYLSSYAEEHAFSVVTDIFSTMY